MENVNLQIEYVDLNLLQINTGQIEGVPKNPRFIKNKEFQDLVRSIIVFPKMLFLRPITFAADHVVLGGNQRKEALSEILALGFDEVQKRLLDSTDFADKPEEDQQWIFNFWENFFSDNLVPAQDAKNLSIEEMIEFVIKDNVGFGKDDFDLLAAEWNLEKVKGWGVSFPEGWGEEPAPKDSIYTNKIEAPIYEPRGKKPEMFEMYDDIKYREMVKQIEAAEIPKRDKDFLKLAATRHIKFNYEKIADYYAASDKKVQELCEASALVIIDFEKAIELGYAKLSDETLKLFKNDYEI